MSRLIRAGKLWVVCSNPALAPCATAAQHWHATPLSAILPAGVAAPETGWRGLGAWHHNVTTASSAAAPVLAVVQPVMSCSQARPAPWVMMGPQANPATWQQSLLQASLPAPIPAAACPSTLSPRRAISTPARPHIAPPSAASAAAQASTTVRGDAAASAGATSASSDTGSNRTQPSSLERWLPAPVVPYAQLMRWDKPSGTWLLLWPCLWSLGLATHPGHLPDPWLTFLFGTGAVLLRGAGCTINDLWDRDIDRRVERTRSRPLAAGTLTPGQAVALLAAQLSLGLAVLLHLNWFTQQLGASSLPLVATYPLMKRFTHWPQAYLGLTFNWGALMGWAAVHGSLHWPVVGPLYGAGVAWTLVYDTIYAHQDKQDDARVGVRSTALLFGDRTRMVAGGFAAVQAAALVAAGVAASAGPAYFAAVAAGAAQQAWQVGTVNLDDAADCMAKFTSNRWYGAILFSGIVVDKLLQGS